MFQYVIQYLLSRLAALHISPIMNVLPSTTVHEGDILEVVCKVVSPPASVEVYLTKDNVILKKAIISLSHRYRAKAGDSGEFVCKAELGSLQKETYRTVTVKGMHWLSFKCLQMSNMI